ncbi:gamma-glutamyltransferase, partial [Ideonella sp.]|uniref:gamma-glutamyltransferase n=1 Tax=Ideonella sp. TaxID=1929293 RepID=UPI003BB723B4
MGLTAFGTSILLACAQSQPPSDRPAPAATASAPVAPWPSAPEGASGWRELQGWTFQRQAVAAANPLAAEAGAQMLREGGSAVDAAVAAQMVLGLVEPQSSGIGGGGLMLVWDGRQVQAWDGRETAPAAADERLFLRADGRPMTLAQAVPGGLSVGVPGVLKMLEAVHREHGRLPWARLFAPAITLAEQGFAVSPRLHSLLAQSQSQSARLDARALAFYFQPPPAPAASAAPVPAQPWPVGHVLRNPA